MKINLPTKITLARIALIPLVLIFYYLRLATPVFILLMTFVFVLASCTDFIDGHIARSRNMVTTLGKFLDPIADKVLVVTGLFIIVDSGVLSIGSLGMIGSVIIMARELAISALRQIAATKGVVMAADKWGKLKTICTLIAIPALFLGMYKWSSNNVISILGAIFWWFGLVMFVISVALTIISGVNYVVKNKQVFSDEKVNNNNSDEKKFLSAIDDNDDKEAEVALSEPVDIEISDANDDDISDAYDEDIR